MAHDEGEIILPRWLAAVAFALVLGLWGYFISPTDGSGRPIFLSPDVKAINDYRKSVSGWHTEMRNIDAQTTNLLSGAFGSDIFEKSRQSQAIVESAFWLLQEIERTEAPTAASPLRNLAFQTTGAYLDAARAGLVWTSEPTDENLLAAKTALEKGRAFLQKMEQSEWLYQAE